MTPRGWRAPPELAAKIAALAEETQHCGVCGADPGHPCTDPPPGHVVHGNRWVGARIQFKRQDREAWQRYTSTAATERTAE